MKLKLIRKVVAGTRRGGEDLVVLLKAVASGHDTLDSIIADAQKAVDALVTKLSVNEDGRRYDDKEVYGFDGPNEFLDAGTFDFVVWGDTLYGQKTDHYEIEYTLPLDVFKKLAMRSLNDRSNWDFVRHGTAKHGRYKCIVEIFRDGNAD